VEVKKDYVQNFYTSGRITRKKDAEMREVLQKYHLTRQTADLVKLARLKERTRKSSP